MLWLSAGAPRLYRTTSFALDPAATLSAGGAQQQPAATTAWRDVAVGAWLSRDEVPWALPNEVQILGLRDTGDNTVVSAVATATDAAPIDFHVNLLLFGRPEHWLRRRSAVHAMRGMQEFKTTFDDAGPAVGNLTAPVDPERVKAFLASTHTNTFNWAVCDCVPAPGAWPCSPLYAYDGFVRFLEATKDFKVDGNQLRVWLGLSPPTEANNPHVFNFTCTAPPDSPLTRFNEAALFRNATTGRPGAYTNYTAWGALAGLLSAQYPHLVALDIDDFSSNVNTGFFTGNDVASITSAMRSKSPAMALASVVYQDFAAFPDLALMLDAPVFFFRNAAEGAGPCADPSCPWGPHMVHRAGQCLAGVCSEPTTYNARLEVASVLAGVPAGRQIVAGFYATGHSSGGQTTPRYVSRMLQSLALQDRVAGVMTYTAKAALSPCPSAPLYDGDLQHQLGCIVANAYAAIAGIG